jgi:hypothetical protein
MCETGGGFLLLSHTCRPSNFCCAEMIFPQPASHSALDQYSPTTRCIVPDLEEPIRAELFGVERLKPHAESLAAAQVVFSEPRLYPLLTRVFWKTAACCWNPTESLPGRFSRSM